MVGASAQRVQTNQHTNQIANAGLTMVERRQITDFTLLLMDSGRFIFCHGFDPLERVLDRLSTLILMVPSVFPTSIVSKRNEPFSVPPKWRSHQPWAP